MAGTNDFDTVGGVTQELLTSFTTALFDNAVNDGTLQNPITIDFQGTSTTVTLSAPDVEICPDPNPATGWSSSLELKVSLAVESPATSGTLSVTTNIDQINLGTVSQADYMVSTGQAGAYADCGSLPEPLPSSGCTLMVWVNLQSSATQTVLTLVDAQNQIQLGLFLGQSLPSLWYGGKTYGYPPAQYYPNLPPASWHHLAAVIGPSQSSGSQVTFYIDGQPQATVAMAGFQGLSGSLLVGGPADASVGAAEFAGSVTGVSVWQSALTASLVQQLMNADLTTPGLDPDLGCLGYWTFNSEAPKNLLAPSGPTVIANPGVSFVQDTDPSFQSYLYFATSDPSDVFQVSNTFPSQYQQQVNDFVTGNLNQKVLEGAIALGSGSSAQGAADAEGEASISAVPSFIHLVTETAASGGAWSGPDQLLFLVMMNTNIPPSFDYQSTFAGDTSLYIPSGDNLALAAWDYFLLSLLVPALEDHGWSVELSTDPVALVATKDSIKLTLSIADGQGLKAGIEAQFGLLADDVWNLDASTILSFTVLPTQSGGTTIEMKSTDTSVAVTANQSSAVVISFEVVRALFPTLGAICFLFASLWRAILTELIYNALNGVDKLSTISDSGRFELSQIAFEDGVIVYGYLSPPGPVITAISATSGHPGDTLTITGQGFLNTGGENLLNAAEIGGQVVNVTPPAGTAQNATTTAAVPLGGTGKETPVRVQATSGNWSNSFGKFVVLGTVAPSNVHLVDTQGVAGDPIEISGSGFTGTTGVQFGTAAAGFTVSSDSSLTATVPLFPQPAEVTVTNNIGSAPSDNEFEPIPPPVIESVTPDAGPPGAQLNITGENFIERSGQPIEVLFSRDSTGSLRTSGLQATTTSGGITVNVPTGAVPGFLWVQTAAGVSSPFQFTVNGGGTPTVKSFSPTAGKAGTQFTLNGSNFTGATRVRIDSQACSQFTLDATSGDQVMTAVVAPQTDSGTVTVTNSVATSQPSQGTFEIIPKPSVSGISPALGVPGDTVSITGSGFVDSAGNSVLDADDGVVIGGQNATVTSVSGTTVKAQVPFGATGIPTPITVNTLGGSATSANFTVVGKGQPVLTSFSPTSGPPGTKVMLAGSGFTGTEEVELNSVSLAFSVISDSQLTGNVPRKMDPGSYSIIVINSNGDSAKSSTPFTVTS